MKDNFENKANLTDEPITENKDNSQTTADEVSEIVVPIKYNKQIVNLDIERAGELAQKGMKFESISQELDTLKELATDSGMTISQYLQQLKTKRSNDKIDALIEKCGDDSELIDEVLRLKEQKSQNDNGFDEVKENFPEIKSISELPEVVIQNAQLHGRRLLDEYLRYRLSQENAVKENVKAQAEGAKASVGSQLNKKHGDNPEAAEFLKGLWRK